MASAMDLMVTCKTKFSEFQKDSNEVQSGTKRDREAWRDRSPVAEIFLDPHCVLWRKAHRRETGTVVRPGP